MAASSILTIIILASLMASLANSAVQTKKNIFVLSGQSNMVGRGNLDELKAPDPMILRFALNKTWETAQDPLHGDIELDRHKYNGVGPGMTFAKSLQLKLNSSFGPIGLVPCAVGATSITQWQKGTFLYDRMVDRARAAVEAGGGEIRALLWYQGESDQGRASSEYKSLFKKFIDDVRADLELPNLPIIEVAIGNEGTIHATQLEIPNEFRNVRCVDALGLPKKEGDIFHLNTAAQVKLGRVMAQVFYNFTINN